VIDTPVKTLSLEDANLGFCHFQPASSFGSVVKLEPIKIRLSLIWREEVIERSWLVRIELIHHNPDAVGIRVVNIFEFDHSINPVCRSSPVGDFDVHPVGKWLRREVDPLFGVAFVPVIDTGNLSRLGPERVAFVSAKCLAGFIKTDD